MFVFEKDLPQNVGIEPAKIKKILETLDKKNIPMHSLLIMKDDKLVFEKYYAPYKRDTLHRMFSISKSFSAVAIALLSMEGKISLDDKICDYFPEYVSDSTHPYIKMLTIRNMLQMRTCHAASTYKVDMTSDWVESFFTIEPTHKPGTIFHYDTSAAHVLCALCEKLSGTDMLSYMKDRMLKYVDFSQNSYMIKDPFGVSMGGSGLMATPMDILKFLYIISKNGRIKCNDGVERTLLPEQFIKEATSNISDTLMTGPVPSEMQGYGMQMWQTEKGGFVLYGMGGQLGISIPQRNILIMTTADTQGIQGGNQVIYDAIYENLLGSSLTSSATPAPTAAKPGATITASNTPAPSGSYADLVAYANSLRIALPRLPENFAYTGAYKPRTDIPAFIKEIASPRGGSEYAASFHLAPNKSEFDKLTLVLDDNGPSSITFEQKKTPHTIYFGFKEMCEGIFPIYDNAYTAGAMWTRDNVLYIKVHLIGESVGSVQFQIFFEKDEITVFMRKIEETYYQLFDGHLQGQLI
ncbi:class A beta-lactamase-related serine hydrolase [Butyrivibrio sp. CB08]|uniref:serine hydrolase domain-containing protein n=1 Tax=Butyrivibrio sp. CB08 TaxID=2364879 RepID=UPI000EAA6BF8|nr:serine hydrolase domain-containing protein [Butyrivibrio sp. CB08]RKM62047.1 class A beta-lactamase-related serine hydrolase [Butyrivibrio sp. CB08]